MATAARRLALFLWICFSSQVLSVHYCSSKQEDTALVCPEGNTCCKKGCIASDLGKLYGTCCEDDDNTGCGANYVCRRSNHTFCHANNLVKDPLVQVLPRYRLCRPPADSLSTVHGLSVRMRNKTSASRLAYYSSHGDILNLTDDTALNITMALVMIHGADRNADDYFCSSMAAVGLHHKTINTTSSQRSVLVIAPRFLAVGDRIISESAQQCENCGFLRWKDEKSGPWRYGANAVKPSAAIHTSSFDAMDRLLEVLYDRTLFPSLQYITVAGHSSGGQFVQRWSLLTKQWQNHRIHAVVANPSSYAYLTEKRWYKGAWQAPPNYTNVCPAYNQWEWGLERSNRDVPYKSRALRDLGCNTTRLIDRFATRRITYLAGGLDRCNVSSSHGWCNSHGLETTCMDELEGSNRWHRSVNYIRSIRRLGIRKHYHRHRVVDGVGHDHSLIFNSVTGLKALFPEDHLELGGAKFALVS